MWLWLGKVSQYVLLFLFKYYDNKEQKAMSHTYYLILSIVTSWE